MRIRDALPEYSTPVEIKATKKAESETAPTTSDLWAGRPHCVGLFPTRQCLDSSHCIDWHQHIPYTANALPMTRKISGTQ
jgi:hypothetical protein